MFQLFRKVSRYLFFLLFFINYFTRIQATDNYDITLNYTSHNSTCQSNGSISVNIAGTDANNLISKTYSLLGDNGQAYRGSNNIFNNLPKGNYDISLSAKINNEIITRDITVTIGGNYTIPSADKVIGSSSDLIGTRPTLNSQNTGRVQLEITGGAFPYSVKVYKGSTLIKTETFTSNQHNGNSPLYPDYKEYYNIENLAAGAYSFLITDACGYTLPAITETIEKIINPSGANTDFYCNGIIMKQKGALIEFDLFSGLLDDKYKYDNGNIWWEYCYSVDNGPFCAWQDFPADGIVTDHIRAKNCNTFDQKYVFKIRLKGNANATCSSTNEFKATKLPPPYNISTWIEPDATGCLPKDSLYKISYANTIYQLPYHLIVTNKTQNQVLGDVVYTSEGWAFKETLTKNLLKDSVRIQLTDNMGCNIADTTLILPEPPFDPPPKVSAVFNTIEDVCTPSKTYDYFQMQLYNTALAVELFESPTSNFYNFKAEYNTISKSWTVNKDNAAIRTDIIIPTTGDLVFKNSTLPNGTYKWRILTKCGKYDTIISNTTFNHYTYEVEHLTCISEKTCQGMVYYPKIKIIRKLSGIEVSYNNPIFFRIKSGVAGGYKISNGLNEGNANKDSILISKSGTYIIETYTKEPPYSCWTETYTINHNTSNVSLKNAYGYVCLSSGNDPATKLGNIEVNIDNSTGVAPYQFDLYNQENTNGRLLQSNNTGRFNNVGYTNDVYSVRITDACKASFVQNVTMQAIVPVHDTIQVCTGTSAYLYARPIGMGNVITYNWTGPDGFTATGKNIIVPNITGNSQYYLNMGGLNCIVTDTFEVKGVSQILKTVKDTICIGHNYSGKKFKPISTNHLNVGTYTYTDLYKSVLGGCDSIVTLKLNIVDKFETSFSRRICKGDSYNFNGKNLTQSNIYSDNFISVGGCDSISYLNLKVIDIPETNHIKEICQGNDFNFNGKTLSKSGIYTEVIPSVAGCDSVVVLDLTINPPITTVLYDTIYTDTPYNKNGIHLPARKTVGNFSETLNLTNANNCDSIITLNLYIRRNDILLKTIIDPTSLKNNIFAANNFDPEDITNNRALTEYIGKYTITVFNRYGQKIAETGPEGWDGKAHGKVADAGVYYYVIEYKQSGQQKQLKGSIEVIKK